MLLVEVTGLDIPWAEPRDLGIGQMPGPPGLPGPSSHYPKDGFLALFADGTVRCLRKDLDEATYRALLSPDSGEKVDPAQCEAEQPSCPY